MDALKRGDVRMRLAAELERQHSEQRTRTLTRAVNQSTSSILITDPSGHIQYVNDAFEKLSGYTIDEVRGKTPAVLKSGIHPQEFYRRMWFDILTKRGWHGDICNRRKNGELCWEHMSITPVFNERGETVNLVGIKEDITTKKQSEQRLQLAETSFDNMG